MFFASIALLDWWLNLIRTNPETFSYLWFEQASWKDLTFKLLFVTYNFYYPLQRIGKL